MMQVYLPGCCCGDASFICQIGSSPPFELFSAGGGEYCSFGEEASAQTLQFVMTALGLAHATPAEFIASLLAFAAPPDFVDNSGDCYYYSSGCYSSRNPDNSPTLGAACKLFEKKKTKKTEEEAVDDELNPLKANQA
jgi:hypothetical protein